MHLKKIVCVRDLERAGVFLLIAKHIVKLSLCAIHPLIKRPTHSFAYLCTFQNPGGWVGSSLMAMSLPSFQLTMVIVFSWYFSKKVNNHK